MMSEKDTGGPAFPVQDASKWQAHGMTLRDYFAAKAMQGLLGAEPPTNKDIKGFDSTAEYIVFAAYKYADYMMKARSGA